MESLNILLEVWSIGKIIGAILILICALSLLVIQYIMVITDIKNNDCTKGELVIGLIPFGPYIAMIAVGVIYAIKKIVRR